MANDMETRRKKLLYQATYRGFKEADLLIGGFAKAHLAAMNEAELDEFEMLLTIGDKELYSWIVGREPAPANVIGPVFEKMRRFELTSPI